MSETPSGVGAWQFLSCGCAIHCNLHRQAARMRELLADAFCHRCATFYRDSPEELLCENITHTEAYTLLHELGMP